MDFENFSQDVSTSEGEKPEGLKKKIVNYRGGISIEEAPVHVGKAGSAAGYVLFALFVTIIITAAVIMGVALTTGETNLMLAAVGLPFAAIGIFLMCLGKSAGGTPIVVGLMFAVPGTAMLIAVFVYYFCNAGSQDVVFNKIGPAFVASLIFGIGIALTTAFIRSVLKKNYCTLLVTAKSTYIAREMVNVKRGNATVGHGVPMWVSYFRYYHNGQWYYCDCEAIPVSDPKPSLGVSKNIYINPDKPQEYSDTSGSASRWVYLILSIMFVAAGVASFMVFF